jgi:hypothetical protein
MYSTFDAIWLKPETCFLLSKSSYFISKNLSALSADEVVFFEFGMSLHE